MVPGTPLANEGPQAIIPFCSSGKPARVVGCQGESSNDIEIVGVFSSDAPAAAVAMGLGWRWSTYDVDVGRIAALPR